MKLIRSIIVDDEPGSVETLSLLLQHYHADVEITGSANSVDAGVSLIESLHGEFDLLFLDIQMPGADGFNLLQRFPDVRFRIIFITAYDSYAIRAFRFAALDYLLKPINKSELESALAKFRSLHHMEPIKQLTDFKQNLNRNHVFEKLAIASVNDIVLVELKKIVYLESDNNYTSVYLENGEKILSSKNIGYYEDILEESAFIRIHNSYLVNLKKVKRYIRGGTGMVEMLGEIRLPLSARRREEFLKNLPLI